MTEEHLAIQGFVKTIFLSAWIVFSMCRRGVGKGFCVEFFEITFISSLKTFGKKMWACESKLLLLVEILINDGY